MTKDCFKITFDGESFSDGGINVRDLISFLCKFDEVVQAATEALSKNSATAHLKVVATGKGSFKLELAIDVEAVEKGMDLTIKAGTIASALFGLFFIYYNSHEPVEIPDHSINEVQSEIEFLLEDLQTKNTVTVLLKTAAGLPGLEGLSIEFNGSSVDLNIELQSSEDSLQPGESDGPGL